MDFVTWLDEPKVIGKECFNKGLDDKDFEKPKMSLDEFYELPEFIQIAIETAYQYDEEQAEVMKAEQYYEEGIGK